jgi:hypothetical protein
MNGPHAVHVTLPEFGSVPRDFEDDEWPAGANLAARTEIARRHPFDSRLGHRAGRFAGHEETALLRTLRTLGRIVYRPDAVVYHKIDAARIDWEHMRRAWFDGGIGLGRYERLERAARPGLPRRIVRAVRTLRAASEARRENAALAEPGPEDAWREFSAYMWAGRHLEMVLGRSGRVTDWFADRVVGRG